MKKKHWKKLFFKEQKWNMKFWSRKNEIVFSPSVQTLKHTKRNKKNAKQTKTHQKSTVHFFFKNKNKTWNFEAEKKSEVIFSCKKKKKGFTRKYYKISCLIFK